MQNSEEIWRRVDDKKDDFIALADRVWGMPDLCYTETKSCAEHVAMREQQGFRITKNVADIPTAIIGEAGEGGCQTPDGHAEADDELARDTVSKEAEG